jgi:nucleoside phosphorylase
MRILICAATATEAKACEKGIKDAGLLDRFEIFQTGVGLTRAHQKLSQRLALGQKPLLVVSSGFAGTLSDSVLAESWVTASQVLLEETGKAVGTQQIEFEQARGCRFISGTGIIRKKHSGDARTQSDVQDTALPIAVDMESAAIAELAERYQVPFMALRYVTDTPREPLPMFVSAFASAMASESKVSAIKLGALGLRDALSDPKNLAQFVIRGSRWATGLRKGWRNHAIKVLQKIDESRPRS